MDSSKLIQMDDSKWGKIGNNNVSDVWSFSGYVKAPGNYLDQVWPHKILVLLLERPQPPNSMIYGFGDP